MLAAWAIFVLPLFFQPPRWLFVCGKGACSWVPPSGYWITVALWTGVLGFLAAFSFYLVLAGSGPGSLRVTVGPWGMRFTLPRDREIGTRWPSRWSYFQISDNREAPRAYQRENPPATIQVRLAHFPLTSEAADGIIAAAREYGMFAGTARLDLTRTSQDPGVLLIHTIRGGSKGRNLGAPHAPTNDSST